MSVADDEVKITEPPAQNVVGPFAVIVGVEGIGLTVTISPIDAPEEQPFSINSTVYVPEVETVILCVVSPVDHKLSVSDDDVKTTKSPEQKVVGPLGVIIGTAGKGFTAICVMAEVDRQSPAPTVTL